MEPEPEPELELELELELFKSRNRNHKFSRVGIGRVKKSYGSTTLAIGALPVQAVPPRGHAQDRLPRDGAHGVSTQRGSTAHRHPTH